MPTLLRALPALTAAFILLAFTALAFVHIQQHAHVLDLLNGDSAFDRGAHLTVDPFVPTQYSTPGLPEVLTPGQR